MVAEKGLTVTTVTRRTRKPTSKPAPLNPKGAAPYIEPTARLFATRLSIVTRPPSSWDAPSSNQPMG
jgi:hypothetical protein